MSIAPGNDDDATLVARCIRGDRAAWVVIVHRYQRLVYTIGRRIGHDEHMAADVFQTVFERLVEHLPRIAEPSRLQAWIVTTARREALLQLKRSQRMVSMTHDGPGGIPGSEWDLEDDSPGVMEAMDELQQLHQLRHLILTSDNTKR